jgi:hypothetical protein
MAFMYDAAYDKVEFGTTHGLKPFYKMLMWDMGTPLDSEMAFMYDAAYDKVEFGIVVWINCTDNWT